MPETFIMCIALAFIVGAIWVTIITRVAEKFGSKIGGIIGGLPSTSALSFLFIALNQSVDAAVATTTVFPIAFGFTVIFLLSFAILAKKGFKKGLLGALLIWFAVSTLLLIGGLKDFLPSIIGSLTISAASYYLFTQKLSIQTFKGKQEKKTPSDLVSRALLAGTLISLAVLANQLAGPVWGALCAAFPATFTSTLIIAKRSRGLEFSRSLTKPLAISGIFTIVPYCVLVRLLYPAVGVWVGTVVSYLAVILIVALLSYLTYRFVDKKGFMG